MSATPRKKVNRPCANAHSEGHRARDLIFECDATADLPATHTESIRGRPRGEEDAALAILAGDRVDGHDPGRSGRGTWPK